ncbi:MAG: MinD/ParA family protein [Leptospirales bacterium]
MLLKDINMETDTGDQASNLRTLVDKLNNNENIENRPEPNPVTKVITVTSGKGGVGKSSVSVNLAIALAKMNKKVILLDADLGLANVNVMLGVIPKYNIYHVVKGHKTIQEILTTTPEGLDVIAGASGYAMLANLPKKERVRIINEFMSLSGYDFMIIDTGAGVGDNVLGFALPADEVLIITTPEPTAITDAYGMIKSIILLDPNKSIQLVVNRAGSSLEAKKVSEKITGITKQFLNTVIKPGGFIYDDEHVGKSVRRQKPFLLQYPGSKASSCIKVIASRLNNLDVKHSSSGGGLSSFFKRVFTQGDDTI